MTPDHLTTLDQLWHDTRTYRQSSAYLDTLRFVSAMREFAPYNAYLLRIQRPLIRFAATREDWEVKFERRVRTEDRSVHPLVVMHPFGPVKFVYDLADTDGPDLPREVLEPFSAEGDMDARWFHTLIENMYRRGLAYQEAGFSSGHAGHVMLLPEPVVAPPNRLDDRPFPLARYLVEVNAHHDLKVRFFTLLHELAHVVCGHLGDSPDAGWPSRMGLPTAVEEIEAESVAFVVGSRLGLHSPSEQYLSNYIHEEEEVPRQVSITTVLTASLMLEAWVKRRSWPRKPKRRAATEDVSK